MNLLDKFELDGFVVVENLLSHFECDETKRLERLRIGFIFTSYSVCSVVKILGLITGMHGTARKEWKKGDSVFLTDVICRC